MAQQVEYRILRPSDLVQYGDERWDFEFGWVRVEDSHLERFSRQYRRAGAQSWRFRRLRQDIRPAFETKAASSSPQSAGMAIVDGGRRNKRGRR